jgi:hypothetical protein
MECKACFRWAVALRVNGIDVPMPAQDIVRGYLQRLHIYEAGRQWAILAAMRDGSTGKRVAVVDIDGVLTEEAKGRDYAARTPRMTAAVRLAHLGRDHWIVLHTARDESDRDVTVQWLARHGFLYDALLMNKPHGDVLVDDCAAAL